MTTQRGPRAFVHDPQPGNHPATGEAFLVSGIDLPGFVRMLGSVPTTPPRPTRWGRSKIAQPQPALDGTHRRNFVPPIHRTEGQGTAMPTVSQWADLPDTISSWSCGGVAR